MARLSPAEKVARIQKVIAAWEDLAPDSVFFGMTLRQFKAEVRPSIEARAHIGDLQRQLRVAITRRDIADAKSMRLITDVGFAVRGDRAHGADGALIEAMGYVRTGGRRKRRRKTR